MVPRLSGWLFRVGFGSAIYSRSEAAGRAQRQKELLTMSVPFYKSFPIALCMVLGISTGTSRENFVFALDQIN